MDFLMKFVTELLTGSMIYSIELPPSYKQLYWDV